MNCVVSGHPAEPENGWDTPAHKMVDRRLPLVDGDDLVRDLAAAVVGTFVARDAALAWGRPPFRGGAVNMDASHIKIEY